MISCYLDEHPKQLAILARLFIENQLDLQSSNHLHNVNQCLLTWWDPLHAFLGPHLMTWFHLLMDCLFGVQLYNCDLSALLPDRQRST
jgi:hypothetical protein